MHATSDAAPAHKTVFGHPRGLATLFFTEMWERFTYYGMRAILILFMVAAVSDGGLGIDDRTASSIYGLYIAATFVFSLLGGWIGDRVTGAEQAVIGGGVLILVGNALLLPASAQSFFLGLLVIVLGVGLLKPNISVMVAHLYPEGARDETPDFRSFSWESTSGHLLAESSSPYAPHASAGARVCPSGGRDAHRPRAVHVDAPPPEPTGRGPRTR